MSARAPLGTPRRKTGRLEAACTRATITGSVDREVMSQAAVTSCIHMQMLAVIQPIHSMRKVGWRRGAQAEGAEPAEIMIYSASGWASGAARRSEEHTSELQ